MMYGIFIVAISFLLAIEASSSVYISPVSESVRADTVLVSSSDEPEAVSREGDKRRASASIHIGVHNSHYDELAREDAMTLGAYHFGISMTVPTAHPQLWVEAGVFYMPQGMRYDSPWQVHNTAGVYVGEGERRAKAVRRSLEFPVSLLYDINPSGSIGTFRFRVGGSMGVDIGSYSDFSFYYQGERYSQRREDPKWLFAQEDLVYSLTTGIEYEIYNVRAALQYMVSSGIMGYRLFGFTIGYRIL